MELVADVGGCADTYAPEPPRCTYQATRTSLVPEAQGSCCATVRTLYAYQPRACRAYRGPWHHNHRWEEKEITKWSKELLREELLPSLTLSLPSEGAALPALPAAHEALAAAAAAGSLSAQLRVTGVEKVDGEATHIISRGKQRVVFEFTLKVREGWG